MSLPVVSETEDSATPPSRKRLRIVVVVFLVAAWLYLITDTEKPSPPSPSPEVEHLLAALGEATAKIDKLEEASHLATEAFEDLRLKRASEKSMLKERIAQLVKAQDGEIIWEPIRIDTFDRKSLGKDWDVRIGEWGLKDGRLRTTENASGSFIVYLGADLSDDVQISYDCRTISGYRGRPCDMSFVLALNRKTPEDVHNGYLFRFGSMSNSYSGLSCMKKTIVKNRDVRIRQGVWHHVTLQRRGTRFSMVVDSKPVFNVLSDDLPRSPDNKLGAFYTFFSIIEIDNFTISRPVRLPGRRGVVPVRPAIIAAPQDPPKPKERDIF